MDYNDVINKADFTKITKPEIRRLIGNIYSHAHIFEALEDAGRLPGNVHGETLCDKIANVAKELADKYVLENSRNEDF